MLGCWQFYRKKHFHCYLQAHGPVDEIEVQVVQFKITESLLTALLYHGLLVEGGPQLQNEAKKTATCQFMIQGLHL